MKTIVHVNQHTEQDVWTPVKGWPKYEISSAGRVRRHNKLIKLFLVDGYPSFNVSDGPARKSLRVHREVLRAFVGEFPAPNNVARHLNGTPSDCRLLNLAWGSCADNSHDMLAHGTRMQGESHHQARLTNREVLAIRNSVEPKVVLSRRYGISRKTVWCIQRNLSWAHL